MAQSETNATVFQRVAVLSENRRLQKYGLLRGAYYLLHFLILLRGISDKLLELAVRKTTVGTDFQ